MIDNDDVGLEVATVVAIEVNSRVRRMWDRFDSILPPGNFTSVPELIYIYL